MFTRSEPALKKSARTMVRRGKKSALVKKGKPLARKVRKEIRKDVPRAQHALGSARKDAKKAATRAMRDARPVAEKAAGKTIEATMTARDAAIPVVKAVAKAARPFLAAAVAWGAALASNATDEKITRVNEHAEKVTKKARRRTKKARRHALLFGGALGAAAAYLFDPKNGTQRRNELLHRNDTPPTP